MSATMKALCLALILGFLGLFLLTGVFGNLYGLLAEKDWFIPEESSVFQFRATDGRPGGGWLYGEDGENYYYSGVVPYLVIRRQNDCSEFDPLDYRTWCEADIPVLGGNP